MRGDKMFTLIIAVTSALLNLNAGCEHKDDEFTCNYFAPCEWRPAEKKCVFGKRPLNSDRDAYSLDRKGTPKIGAHTHRDE